jgi:hypothetical protein
MKAFNLIIATLTISLIIGCSSSKKTTTENKETTESESTNTTEESAKLTTEDTAKEQEIEKVTLSKGEKADPRENTLADAIASYPDSLVAMLSRTACYGRCPVYIVKIYNSGYASYEGKSNTEMVGLYTGKISKENLTSITTKADAIKFFELKNIYDTNVTDFPSVHLYINNDGNKKQILDRQGGPAELKELQTLLDELAKSANWKKQ